MKSHPQANRRSAIRLNEPRAHPDKQIGAPLKRLYETAGTYLQMLYQPSHGHAM
jgi:hypothetical protein